MPSHATFLFTALILLFLVFPVLVFLIVLILFLFTIPHPRNEQFGLIQIDNKTESHTADLRGPGVLI